MSTRIHFRGENVGSLQKEIDEFASVMKFDEEKNEITTFTKTTNSSFYEIGNDWLYGSTKEFIPTKMTIIGYFSEQNPRYASVLQPKEVQTFFDKHSGIIQNIEQQESDWFKLEYTQHLIQMYRFAMKHNLEIWCY